MNHLNQKIILSYPKSDQNKGSKMTNFDLWLLSCPGLKMAEFINFENLEDFYQKDFWEHSFESKYI